MQRSDKSLSLDELATGYGCLEKEIQKYMGLRSNGVCARCTDPCCRIDFCRESLESPFLVHVANLFTPLVQWDRRLGWLTPQGCGLSAGRPPVCYEFLCRRFEEGQPTSFHTKALRVLANLMTDAGKGARGRRHLVELSDLSRLNLTRLTRQVDQARSRLKQLQCFWEDCDSSGLADRR